MALCVQGPRPAVAWGIALLLVVLSALCFGGCSSGGASGDPPQLAVDPAWIVLEASETSQTLQVSELAAGTDRDVTATGEVDSGTAWITSVSPGAFATTGTTPVPVTVQISRAGLTEGVYEGRVQLNSTLSDLRQSRQSVRTYAIVGGGDDPDDGFWIAPSELSFSSAQTSLPIQLHTQAGMGTWSIIGSATWVSATPSQGGEWNPLIPHTDQQTTVQVTVDRSGLADGVHTAWLLAQRNQASLLVKLTVTVGSPPVVEPGMITYWSDGPGNSEIHVMRDVGTGVARLTTSGGRDEWPCWSPDNTKIAWETDRAGGANWEIYAMSADGTGTVNLTANAAEDLYPDYSPDGARIAFGSGRDGNREIYAMNANGTSPVRLTNHSGDDRHPSWSADGSRIAFDSDRDTGSGAPTTPPDRNRYDIYAMNANGTGVTRLTSNAVCDWQPCWSPDGSRIAFISNRAGAYEVYVMNADGSNPQRLTTLSGDANKPSWSPDGAWIAFSCAVSGNTDVYKIRADGTGLTRLTTGAAVDAYPSWRSWD